MPKHQDFFLLVFTLFHAGDYLNTNYDKNNFGILCQMKK